jgi:pyruvate/2-oxoglutarate/acetoin dehydrogenase E1 component
MPRTLTFIEAINEALRQEMERDERVFILGEDIGFGGVFKATEGLLEKFGEERVVDTPLAEGIIIGASIGSSLAGLRPVPEIQFADFITVGMDQIVEQAAKLRYRSAGGFNCPITIRICCGGGVGGGLYHSQENAAWFVHEPGLKVVMPATPYDAKGMLLAAIRDPNPVLYFEHKKLYRTVRGEVPEDNYTVPLGTAAVRREGRDLTVLTYGYMTHVALEAAEAMAPRRGSRSPGPPHALSPGQGIHPRLRPQDEQMHDRPRRQAHAGHRRGTRRHCQRRSVRRPRRAHRPRDRPGHSRNPLQPAARKVFPAKHRKGRGGHGTPRSLLSSPATTRQLPRF